MLGLKKDYSKELSGITKVFNVMITRLMKFQQDIQKSRNEIKVRVENLKQDDVLLEGQEDNIKSMVKNINNAITPKQN